MNDLPRLCVLSFWPNAVASGRLSSWRAYIPQGQDLPEVGTQIYLFHRPGIWTVTAQGLDLYGDAYFDVTIDSSRSFLRANDHPDPTCPEDRMFRGHHK